MESYAGRRAAIQYLRHTLAKPAAPLFFYEYENISIPRAGRLAGASGPAHSRPRKVKRALTGVIKRSYGARWYINRFLREASNETERTAVKRGRVDAFKVSVSSFLLRPSHASAFDRPEMRTTRLALAIFR